MVSIVEALGKDYYNIKLYDNENPYGGKAHMDEVLGEFMEVGEISPKDDYGELCVTLEQCGIMSIRPLVHIEDWSDFGL